ncbi:hypothetical protein Dimus_024680, partial [Dionaea muscipula]
RLEILTKRKENEPENGKREVKKMQTKKESEKVTRKKKDGILNMKKKLDIAEKGIEEEVLAKDKIRRKFVTTKRRKRADPPVSRNGKEKIIEKAVDEEEIDSDFLDEDFEIESDDEDVDLVNEEEENSSDNGTPIKKRRRMSEKGKLTPPTMSMFVKREM